MGDIVETPLWIQVWSMKAPHIAAFAIFLILIILVMVFRDSLSKRGKMLEATRYAILTTSFVYVGLVLKAQPTTTNIIILINGLKELKFPIGLYTLEPFIFLTFIFITITLVLWGRGVFCGWLCPYGALLELLSKAYRKLFPGVKRNLPYAAHRKLAYLKYAVFAVILTASFFQLHALGIYDRGGAVPNLRVETEPGVALCGLLHPDNRGLGSAVQSFLQIPLPTGCSSGHPHAGACAAAH